MQLAVSCAYCCRVAGLHGSAVVAGATGGVDRKSTHCVRGHTSGAMLHAPHMLHIMAIWRLGHIMANAPVLPAWQAGCVASCCDVRTFCRLIPV